MSLLDPLYYAVSGVMWCWHELFGLVFGPSSGVAWALSVVFLVLTLRALLIRPFVAQLRSGRVMQAIAPQLAELRTRHADDPKRLVEETRALQREHGVSTLGGCLPALLQIPVFLGLVHVLTQFNRHGLTVEQNAQIPNYSFPAEDVRSFLDAHLFGVPLSGYLSMPQQLLDAFGGHVERWEVAAVAVPLTLLTAVVTHLSARQSARRQTVDGPAGAFLRLMPWIYPVGVLVTGGFFPFPIATQLYWLTNSSWTLAQQWFAFRSAPAVPVTPAAPVTPAEPVAAAIPSVPAADVPAAPGSAAPADAVPQRRREPARRRRHASGHRPSRRRR